MPHFDAEEIRPRDAEDRKWPAIQRHGAFQDIGSARELALPEGIADHGARRAAARPVVVRGEGAAQHRLHTQHAEKTGAHEQTLGVVRFAAHGQVEPRGAPREDPRKGLLAVAKLFPLTVSKAGAARGKPARAVGAFGVIDVRQILRPFHRQRTQSHRIHQLKDRRIGPNAERQRKHRNCGESRIQQELPRAVTHVLPHVSCHGLVSPMRRRRGSNG